MNLWKRYKYAEKLRRASMVSRRIILMSLCCLILLAATAWAGQALLMQGMEAQKAGRHEQALKLLDQYIEKYPQIGDAWYYRALALQGLNRDNDALASVDKA